MLFMERVAVDGTGRSLLLQASQLLARIGLCPWLWWPLVLPFLDGADWHGVLEMTVSLG